MNNSKWVVKSDKNGNVNLNGTALYSNAVKTINGSNGGTASGNITVSKATTDSSQVRVTNSLRSGSLHVSGTGNLGIYDIDHSKWLIKSDINGNSDFSGTATYATNSGTANYTKTINGASGGTVSSNVCIAANSSTNTIYNKISNKNREISLQVSAANNAGIYDHTNSKWLLCASSAGDISMGGTANYAKNSGTAGSVKTNYSTFNKFTTTYLNSTVFNIYYTTMGNLNILSFYLLSNSTVGVNRVGSFLKFENLSTVINKPKYLNNVKGLYSSDGGARNEPYRVFGSISTDGSIDIRTADSNAEFTTPYIFTFIYIS